MAELNLCFASLFGPPCKWFSIIEPESIAILVMGVLARVGEHRKVFFLDPHVMVVVIVIMIIMIIMIIMFIVIVMIIMVIMIIMTIMIIMIITIIMIMIIMRMIIIVVVVITIFITLLMVVMNHANNNAVDNVFWWCCCWWWCNMLGAPYHKPRASLGKYLSAPRVPQQRCGGTQQQQIHKTWFLRPETAETDAPKVDLTWI